MDADIYLSAMQALDFLFAHKLIVPSTFVRYDDWPRTNSTHGPFAGTNYRGQARAHYELSQKWDVRWRFVAKGVVQVISIGSDVCAPSLCDRSIPIAFSLEGKLCRDEVSLLPLWSPGHVREALC